MLRTRIYSALWLGLSFCGGQSQAYVTDGLAGFDAIVTQAMTDWEIPGASIAIVRDGKVLYVKGFGYRDAEKKLPVTTHTLFAIGSISKSFTSLVFGILNDEGLVEWDKPIRTYLPEFQLDDPIASQHATPIDLFSHRTGLPGHDLVWFSSNFSREDLFNRLRYLKSNKEFRSGYQYNNLMVMTMGYLEGRVANSTWEDLVRSRVFQPLDMRGPNFSVNDSQKSSDFAQPYELKKNVVRKVPFKNLDSIGPAGSINSSIEDMSHYLVFQLGDGSYNGKKIVSQPNLDLVHAGRSPMGPLPPFIARQGIGPMTYALGWVDTTYRGHHMVWHNGGIDGFHALLTMLPDDKTGVVILANMADTMALEPIAYSAFDRLVGLPKAPWLDRYKKIREMFEQHEQDTKKNTAAEAKLGAPPSHPIADFAGDYVNPGYGTIRIGHEGDALQLAVNQAPPTPLKHLRYDVFEIPVEFESGLAGTKGEFYMNKDGDIDRLAIPLEGTLPEDIVFKRVPARHE